MINYDLFKNIEEYAKRHLESSGKLYKSRGESNIFQNILRGKIAEFCCYFSMKKAGYILESMPDLNIYSEYNKSHDADLICIGKDNKLYDIERHIHIKSVSNETYNKMGASFLIEKNNPLVENPKDNHYYSVLVQNSLTDYSFHFWVNSCEANYELPKNPKLHTKYAVYCYCDACVSIRNH